MQSVIYSYMPFGGKELYILFEYVSGIMHQNFNYHKSVTTNEWHALVIKKTYDIP